MAIIYPNGSGSYGSKSRLPETRRRGCGGCSSGGRLRRDLRAGGLHEEPLGYEAVSGCGIILIEKKCELNIIGWWFQPTPLKNHGARQLGL